MRSSSTRRGQHAGRAAGVVLVMAAFATLARDAAAQGPYASPPPRPLPLGPVATAAPAPRRSELTTDLRSHFGVELAARLLRSDDPEERLQGLERAASGRTAEGMSLLVRALESGGAARLDARALIAVARGLAPFASQSEARSALQGIVNAPPIAARSPLRESIPPQGPFGGATSSAPPRGSHLDEGIDEVTEQGRVELARGIAALALASSPDMHAVDTIAAIARGGGGGQSFAANAILAFPLVQMCAVGSFGALNPPMIRLLAAEGDLRGLDGIRSAARAGDSATRTAALSSLAEMGDARALELARAATKDIDPQVRAAAANALVLLGAPERLRAIDSLLADNATVYAGAELALAEQDAGVVKALAARVVVTGDAPLRRAIVAALGRSTEPVALEVLGHLTTDPTIGGEAAAAIARSPSPSAGKAVRALLGSTPTRRLGARACVVRAIVRGERDGCAGDVLAQLASSSEPLDRAAGLAALVALGERDLGPALADKDPRVRRAVAGASRARPSRAQSHALLARLASEPDAATRQALSIGLVDGDPDGQVTTLALIDRAESGGPDAPLAAMAFARRAEGSHAAKVDALLASRDPLLRAHAARGLGASLAKDAIGRLAHAFAYEPDAAVRRAVVLAVAGRSEDGSSLDRQETLRLASRLDPDRAVREMAARALAGLPAGPAPPGVREVAWLRLAAPDGAPPSEGLGSPAAATGILVDAAGLALPIAFDEDGYAVIVIPPGEARLALAPRVPAYEAARP